MWPAYDALKLRSMNVSLPGNEVVCTTALRSGLDATDGPPACQAPDAPWNTARVAHATGWTCSGNPGHMREEIFTFHRITWLYIYKFSGGGFDSFCGGYTRSGSPDH